jgi:hypothetical protein
VTINPDAAFSRGDVMRRLADLERQVADLSTARRLESASIGTGGLSVRGGHVIIQDASGVETMRLSTDGLSLTGLLSVLGSIDVEGGGDITVTDGRLVARDSTGDVFRVDPTVPEIFMRKALISALSSEILGDRVHTASVATDEDLTDEQSFGDLPSAGPSVSGVTITFGIAVVFVGCRMAANLDAGLGISGGDMGVAVSGATTVAAAEANSYSVTIINHNSLGTNRTDGGRSAAFAILPLNPGVHTFTAKYKTRSDRTTSFSERSLMVIAL